MADKTQGNNNADHGSVSVGHNDGSITVNNQFLIQSDLTDKADQEREAQYLRRVVADCGGLEWLTLMNLEDLDLTRRITELFPTTPS